MANLPRLYIVGSGGKRKGGVAAGVSLQANYDVWVAMRAAAGGGAGA